MSGATSAEGGCYALLTGPGPAAVATVRLCGVRVPEFVRRHLGDRSGGPSAGVPEAAWRPGAVRRMALRDDDEGEIDDILVSVHHGPPTWDLRLHLHGNPWVVRRCTELAAACGLRPAPRPEADLWPLLTPLMAEACELLPHVLTWRGVQWILDQADPLDAAVRSLLDEADEAMVRRVCRRLIRNARVVRWFCTPLRVALVGPPNAGKSSLANALGDRAASVVSATPGTTRDWVEVAGEVAGFPVTWLDTAGLGEPTDALEQAGMDQTRALLSGADAVVLVLDATDGPAVERFLAGHRDLSPTCVALNKRDLGGPVEGVGRLLPPQWRRGQVHVSAVQRWGLEQLAEAVLRRSGRTERALAGPAAFAGRQVRLLGQVTRAQDRKAIQAKLLQLVAGNEPDGKSLGDGLRHGTEER